MNSTKTIHNSTKPPPQQQQLATTTTKAKPPHPSSQFPQITKCKTTRDLSQVHAHLIKTGHIHDPLASAELLKALALSDFPKQDLSYARKLFATMENPNAFSWNTIIRACAESERSGDGGGPLDALLYFRRMVCVGDVMPNKFTFPSVLKACAEVWRVEEGMMVHGLVVKLGVDGDEFVVSNLVRMYVMCGVMENACALFRSRVFGDERMRRRGGEGGDDVVLWNVMIDGYVRTGDLVTCKELFDKITKRSVVSWNIMISGYAQNGFFKEAIEMFRAMQLGEIRPNYVTLLSVLPAIARLGALELGKWVHLYAERSGIEIDDVLGSALIDMYSKCGSIEKAVQVFETIRNKNNAVTWSAVIGGLAMHGRANDALYYFKRMQEAGVRPSDVVYIGLLNACGHAGLVDEGRSFFHQMVHVKGLEPRVEHYGCMVDLLGRAGVLDEAEHLILNMPVKPDDVILKALLGACKVHGNVEMGERVARVLMDRFPNDSGSYVALSNIFASKGYWDEVAQIRLQMKENQIRKDPGCSWIELDGEIHEFLVEDNSHPTANEIHEMLEEISDKSKLAGYRPNTALALLNVDEEGKQNALQQHSERIAIAFGLISTSPKTTLHIVKNLRVCEDCHSLIKVISKIYERKIIVRDRKRFHHFENGYCSCMDYW